MSKLCKAPIVSSDKEQDMAKKPTVLSRTIVHENPFYRIRHDKLVWPDGKPGDYYVHEVADASVIIALDGDVPERILFIEQYRHALGKTCIELPAGHVDNGETPVNCARRELEEETGWRPARMKEIGAFEHNGASSSKCYVFIARELQHGRRKLESSESGMTLLTYTPEEVDLLIATGGVTDRVALSAWAIYRSKFPPSRG